VLTRNQAKIKVDWDSETEPDTLQMDKLLQRAGYCLVEREVRRSPSGNGWHIVMHVLPRPRCVYEVIALQAILGGDVWREARQMQRARAFPRVPKWMRDKWNVLYLPHPQRSRHLSLGD
jgi:hypothetical protein